MMLANILLCGKREGQPSSDQALRRLKLTLKLLRISLDIRRFNSENEPLGSHSDPSSLLNKAINVDHKAWTNNQTAKESMNYSMMLSTCRDSRFDSPAL